MALIKLGNDRPINPCKKFIEFKGGVGKFQYWDKEKKVNIEVKRPLEFVVLAVMQTAKGYHEESGSSIYSNEVYNGRQEMNVRSFKGVEIANGFWKDIKDAVKCQGGKFCFSIYAIMNKELVNFQLLGAACSPWIDSYSENVNKYKVTKLETRIKGINEYKVPIFEPCELSQEEIDKCKEEGREVEEYLKDYIKYNNDEDFETKDNITSADDFKDFD